MIKYRSNTHTILLMLQSAKGSPKTMETLMFISDQPRWKIQRALDVLLRKGLVSMFSENSFQVTAKGTDCLHKLARNDTRTIKDDHEMVHIYEQSVKRNADRSLRKTQ